MPKTHEVEARFRFSNQKVGIDLRHRCDRNLFNSKPPKSNMADQVYGDAFAPNFFIIVAENETEKGNPSHNGISIICLAETDFGIEHVLIGVENRSRVRMTHVPKVASNFPPPENRRQFLSASLN